MTDKSFAAHADRFRAWQETRSPDLAQAEARIDALLAAMFEQSRILSDQDGELVYRSAMLGASLTTIERQQRTIDWQLREIARMEAEIARMRTDPARRRTIAETLVDNAQRLYKAEGE